MKSFSPLSYLFRYKYKHIDLKSLGISDEDAGISYREDKNKGTVRIQRGKWMLRMFNNSWSGARILIEEYSPKEVDRSLMRNQVSHVYETKDYN